MRRTSNVCNQGIVHLARDAGERPFCGSRRGHISVAVAESAEWPRLCAKCQRVLENAKERAARKVEK